MLKNYGLQVITEEELFNLAISLTGLSRARLQPTWAYIQSIKYNGMIQEGDCAQPNLIFHGIEIPLIKRLYPPELLESKIKAHLSSLLKKTKAHSKEKFQQYLELRRMGISIERARKQISPIYPEKFLIQMAWKYARSVKIEYNLTCRDADLLYNLGLDQFIKLFPEKLCSHMKQP